MGNRQIGSYFEDIAEEYQIARTSAPATSWASEPHLALATGRHALTIAARELRSRGIARIALPDYLCASMVDPFSDTAEITFYSLTADLEPTEDAFIGLGSGDAVLVCAFFGRSVPIATADSVKAARRRGALIVSDTTHSPFNQPAWPYDLNIVSLRKTLPIHDGAILAGDLTHATEPLVDVANDAISTRRHAAAEKRNLIMSGGTTEKPAHALRHFESYLESLAEPARMSVASTRILGKLDLDALAERRTRNLRHLLPLVRSIPGIAPLTGYEGAYAPAFLTCQLPDASNAQATLATQGIFCPIHWPQPSRLKDRAWRHDLLSLPVDHRYNETDMAHIARSLRDYMERGTP